MEVTNRYVTIKHHLDGAPKGSDFELKTVSLSLSLEAGSNHVLVKNCYVSIDPYQLNRMKSFSSSQGASVYSLSLSPGKAIDAYGVARVVASTNLGFKEDDLVVGMIGWEEYSLISNAKTIRKLEDAEFPPSYQVGILGFSGLAAYVGFYNIGKPKKGEKVFVSAASGSVGNLVGQYAKLFGCYVVGCAGSNQKVDVLKDKLGFDDAFNYKEESDLKATLQRYFPDGIDIYFDNVGGEMLEAAVANMNTFGRVALCGIISEYTNSKKRAAPNMLDVVYKRITIQGFLAGDHMNDFGDFISKTSDYLRQGKIHVLEDISNVTCSCPSGHREFIWHMDYTVQAGDSWDVVSSKFGWFILVKPEKQLIVSQNIILDVLCGCSEKVPVVTYRIEAGDTLFTICSRFKASMDQTAKLNRLDKSELIHVGDIIFIPVPDLDILIQRDDNNDSEPRQKSNRRRYVILGSVAAAAAGTLLLFSAIFWIFYHRRKSSKMPNQDETSLFRSHRSTIFSYTEVLDATSNFDIKQKIGQGSYGSVYLGRLRGTDVAIKQMKNTKSKEFLAELNILCRVHHTNLIDLKGYAVGGDYLFLVYEFAQNGALSDHLHDPTMRGHKSLTWTRRVQIALDAAKGLEYIHAHTKPYYVHRDVKTSNILLDSNLRTKIADFGLVKLLENSPEVGAETSKIVGTFGYLAPEYARDGCVTTKVDVYAYGVVLMELLTGQKALGRNETSGNDHYSEHRSLVDLMLSALEDDHSHLTKCIDPSLIHYEEDSLLQMALLSKDCVDDNWKQRPDMSKVVLRLSYIQARTLQWEGKQIDHVSEISMVS